MPPNVGLEPKTLRLRVSCSTDWASRAVQPSWLFTYVIRRRAAFSKIASKSHTRWLLLFIFLYTFDFKVCFPMCSSVSLILCRNITLCVWGGTKVPFQMKILFCLVSKFKTFWITCITFFQIGGKTTQTSSSVSTIYSISQKKGAKMVTLKWINVD